MDVSMQNLPKDDEYLDKVLSAQKELEKLEKNKEMLYSRGRRKYFDREAASERADGIISILADLTIKYGFDELTDDLKERAYKINSI